MEFHCEVLDFCRSLAFVAHSPIDDKVHEAHCSRESQNDKAQKQDGKEDALVSGWKSCCSTLDECEHDSQQQHRTPPQIHHCPWPLCCCVSKIPRILWFSFKWHKFHSTRDVGDRFRRQTSAPWVCPQRQLYTVSTCLWLRPNPHCWTVMAVPFSSSVSPGTFSGKGVFIAKKVQISYCRQMKCRKTCYCSGHRLPFLSTDTKPDESECRFVLKVTSYCQTCQISLSISLFVKSYNSVLSQRRKTLSRLRNTWRLHSVLGTLHKRCVSLTWEAERTAEKFLQQSIPRAVNVTAQLQPLWFLLSREWCLS